MGLKMWFQIWGWGVVFQVKHVHVTFMIFYVKSLIFSFHKHPTMSLLVMKYVLSLRSPLGAQQSPFTQEGRSAEFYALIL